MIDSINIVMKPVGDRCNLRCKYCYTDSVQYCGEPISVDEVKKFIMKLETDNRFQHIKFTWHGGEPLLWGVDKYNEIFQFQKEHLRKKEYMNIFQTNGTLITQSYVDLIKKFEAYIGISIDGPTYALNSQRFEKPQEFQTLLQNFELLKANQVEFAIFCTLTRTNIGCLTEIFDFIEMIKPYAYTLIPVMDAQSYITRFEWSDILEKTNEFSQRTGIPHSYTVNLNGLRPRMCMMNGRCQSFITIDNHGVVNKTCRINHDLIIGNLKDSNVLDQIADYAFKPLEIKPHSIFSYLQDRKYIYFQGDGCYYRKRTCNNEDFVAGIVSYLKKR